MTQSQLDRSVARSTGESLRTIRNFGFHLQAGFSLDLEPENLHLAVACPRCGIPRTLSCDRQGPTAMGECVPCDLRYDYRPSDVRVAV